MQGFNDRLAGMDFASHNAEVKVVWESFYAGKPIRVPIILGTNTRYFMFNDRANPEKLQFNTYMKDPDVMYEASLRFARWSRYNLLQDAELGLPGKWSLSVDFQNFYDAAWFGCPIEYIDNEVPDTSPRYAELPEKLMESGIPDPFSGVMGKALEYYEHMKARAEGDEYYGRPVEVSPPWCGMGTDGPMTVACNLFGATFVCETLASDPDRISRLLDFITDALITRMRAFRMRFNVPVPQDNFGFADDSVALISSRMFKQVILPLHRRIYDAFGTTIGRSMHLCGNATRHFNTLRDELGVMSFDTGFPVDFTRLRKELGPNIRILGGPRADLLLSGTMEQIHDNVHKILESGIMEGGGFVLREGNNLAPRTPLKNTEAMYKAGREFGQYQKG